MVYVDKLFYWPNKGQWCHMWADTVSELHEMASKIGLKREWFQENKRLNHYDLRESKRRLAIKNGATEMHLKDWILKSKQAQ